ncbi:TMEM165/GDT1 family protein [Glycomyces sp. TRM65418]|uniref:TMEM165/GDT1 family protein n=1 Tax=Glycomyces sp. TRM65418 TaxID=2867006 RepID=UPI001CE51C1E|nr:TMEM165/GDT1 family protein [Glycomyces sp. TRM65418]MCC3762037.1 TMEM165/GDT1 family protein [Glycomyces sp. TRM65418]QZD56108.1 TMEM165/GDT1 family protein [Glycomyces sp. TRM65418]
MDAFLGAAAISFGLVFVGEMGDKSQLMALTFATKYRLRSVILGLVIAIGALIGLSVGVGAVAGNLLPTDWIRLAAAILFIGFGLWGLRGGREEDDDLHVKERRSGLLTVIAAMFLAEFGDKTMIVAMGLGSSYNPWAVWLGGTAGMLAADLLAVFAGAWVARRIPEKVIRYVSSGLFLVIGVLLGVEAVTALAD